MNQKKREKYGTDVNGIVIGGIARWVVLPASVLLGACSADPVDLGDGRLGVDRSALESYAAVWEGYVEAYEFQSGSDRVRLVLDEQGDGTIRFGAGEPLPQPSDPEEPFPFDRYDDTIAGIFGSVPVPIESFDYDIAGALVEAERLRAAMPTQQIFAAACAIQTPIDTSNGSAEASYACIPSYVGTRMTPGDCALLPTGGTEQAIACPQLVLCQRFCDCDATSCVPRDTGEQLRLDAALNDAGDRLEGTLVGAGQPFAGSERATVRLTRVAGP